MNQLRFILFAIIAFSSFAVSAQNSKESARYVVRCGSDDGATQVDILLLANGQYKAVVTTESTGGSYPTFPYHVKEVQKNPGIIGAGLEYKGRNFDLRIKTDVAPNSKGIPSVLTASNLDIKHEAMNCKLR